MTDDYNPAGAIRLNLDGDGDMLSMGPCRWCGNMRFFRNGKPEKDQPKFCTTKLGPCELGSFVIKA